MAGDPVWRLPRNPLTSRSGAATPEAEAFVKGIRQRGIEVQVVRADIGSKAGRRPD